MATEGNRLTVGSSPSDPADAESAWLQAEVAALGPDPDAAALAAFEARCEQRYQAKLAEVDRHLAEMDRDDQAAAGKVEAPARPVLKRGRAIVGLFLSAWVLTGPLLEHSMGSVFFFSRGDGYSSTALWAFLGLLLPVGWGLGRFGRRDMADRFPTWAVRWLIFFPFAVAATAGAFVAAPLGWIALAGWAVGTPAEMEASVVSVDTRMRSGFGCRQKGRLRIAGREGNICLSTLVGGEPMPRPGDDVRVIGRSSGLGVFVREVRRR